MFQLESKKWKYVPRFLFGGIYVTTIRLSTVKLPGDYGYETCIFRYGGDSEVLERYETRELAIEGHRDHTIAYGLKYSKYSL